MTRLARRFGWGATIEAWDFVRPNSDTEGVSFALQGISAAVYSRSFGPSASACCDEGSGAFDERELDLVVFTSLVAFSPWRTWMGCGSDTAYLHRCPLARSVFSEVDLVLLVEAACSTTSNYAEADVLAVLFLADGGL